LDSNLKKEKVDYDYGLCGLCENHSLSFLLVLGYNPFKELVPSPWPITQKNLDNPSPLHGYRRESAKVRDLKSSKQQLS